MSKVANASLWRGDYCQYCGAGLGDLGYYFTCHVCGENYCYIHMQNHTRAHATIDGKEPPKIFEE